ncbi:MAG: hypothetical protein KF843_05850 [Flavobacteriales bacterium]|nr:hypothetical protein [Flavobacteriales bacterium]
MACTKRMKNAAWTFIVLGAIATSPASAQTVVHLYNASLIDTSLNIVYRGVGNTIVVSPWQADDHPQLTHTAEGTLHAEEDTPGQFRYMPRANGTDTFRLLRQGRIVAERIFVGKELGWPQIRFGNLNGTIATVEELLADPQLHATIPDCEWIGREARVIGYVLELQVYGHVRIEMLEAKADKDVRMKIESVDADIFNISLSYAVDSVAEENLFTGEITMKHERSWDEYIYGGSLPLPYQQLIAELESGERLMFSSVKVIQTGGCPIRLSDYSITVR